MAVGKDTRCPMLFTVYCCKFTGHINCYHIATFGTSIGRKGLFHTGANVGWSPDSAAISLTCRA